MFWFSQRTRKRRVRDLLGNWCDSRDLEGQTYEVYLHVRQHGIQINDTTVRITACYLGTTLKLSLVPLRRSTLDGLRIDQVGYHRLLLPFPMLASECWGAGPSQGGDEETAQTLQDCPT